MSDPMQLTLDEMQIAMRTYVQQGNVHEEMKRRAHLLKLEADMLLGAIEVLEKSGLRAEGTELVNKQ